MITSEVKLLLKQRKELINNTLGNSFTTKLYEGVLKVNEPGLFKTKSRTIILTPQFLIIAEGDKSKDKILDAVVLKNATVEPEICKDFSSGAFPFTVVTPYHSTVHDHTVPGAYTLTSPTVELRGEWIMQIQKVISLLQVCLPSFDYIFCITTSLSFLY